MCRWSLTWGKVRNEKHQKVSRAGSWMPKKNQRTYFIFYDVRKNNNIVILFCQKLFMNALLYSFFSGEIVIFTKK